MITRFTVLRDTREKPQHGWHFDEDAYCAGTEIHKLDTGDYTIRGLEDVLCVERKKTIDEFASNCIQERWTRCLERMSQFKHSYLLLEFSKYVLNNYPYSSSAPPKIKRKLRMSSKFIRRNIYNIRHDYNIHVLLCTDRAKAEMIAYRIMRKAYELTI